MECPQSPSTYQLFVGVDIAAATATVAGPLPQKNLSKPLSIDQTSEGFVSLQQTVLATGMAPAEILVVMEATGTYWLSLATFLVRHGFVVSVINPGQAHHFAKALLKLAKTDASDAQTLAQLAKLLQPAPWTPPPAIYEEFQQRLAQRDALLLMRGQLRNQLHALVQGPILVAQVRERMKLLDQTITSQIKQIETELLAMMEAEEKPGDIDQEWVETITLLQSIPGIGLLTAMWIVVCTLNFTLCSWAEQAAAYAGLAPMPRQSGTSVLKRPCIGHTGNGRLRTALYLATLSAARYNPVIKRFYDRLRAQGKPAKVARCAAARKLLHLAFAVATNKEDFDPHYQPSSKQQAARA